MIDVEYVKYPPTSIDDIEDKKFSEFEESVRRFSKDKNHTLTNLLLKRHFLIKSV